MVDRRISTMLLRLGKNVSLKFNLNLVGKNREGVEVPNLFHTTFENSKGGFHTVDIHSYLILELKDPEGGWDRTKSIILTPMNLYQFINHLDRLIANIYKSDSFFIDDQGETKVNKDKLEEYRIVASNIGMSQTVVMEPSVVYDFSEDTYYEGAMIMLNRTDNFFHVPIDWLESFKYTLSKFDFFVYTHTLLQYYMNNIYDPDKEVEVISGKPKRGEHVLFQNSRMQVEHVDDKDLERVAGRIAKKPDKKDTFDI